MPDLGSIIKIAIIIVFALLVPLAILGGRFAIKRQRQDFLNDLLETLKDTSGRKIDLIPSFEFALHKYDLIDGENGRRKSSYSDTIWYYAGTSFLFIVLSWIGFSFVLNYASQPGSWTYDNFIFSSFGPSDAPEAYRRMSGGAFAFAFLGSYIWSINYLIGRIANFDLSPASFLRISARVILACVTALVLRHVFHVDGIGAVPDVLVLLFAFIIGFYPTVGLDYMLQRIPQLRTKRLDDETAAVLRVMPVEIIDGIDSGVSFRLAEREIVDVQNLATENPILLCAETPYTALEVLDWISQAQLALEVGPRAYKALRGMGIRTIFALEEVKQNTPLEDMVLKVLYGEGTDRPDSIEAIVGPIGTNIHVERLRQIREVLHDAYALRKQQKPTDVGMTPPVLAVMSLVGTNAVGVDGQDVAKVENFLVDTNGQAKAVVVEWGSFFGAGERRAAVSRDQFRMDSDGGPIKIDMTREQLEGSPEYRPDDIAALGYGDVRPLC